LTAIPVSPKSFVLYFATGGNELTPESAEQLPEIGNLVSHLPAAEIIVFGHTDTVGSLETNDALSLRRAQTVRDRLITAGVPAERIVAVGPGKRDLLIATGDEVAEPRNRRVEVKIR
jgi:outer membrane protein OmpA-like peptidoglycan-associated protein